MFYFLRKYGKIGKAHRKATGFEDKLLNRNTILSLILIYFFGWEFEETFRKAEFERENKVPWSLNPDTR